MIKLKKILSAVLALSLLVGFSVSIASFATSENMYKGISNLFNQPEWFNNADVEDYIINVKFSEDKIGSIVRVSNSAVAQANGVQYDGQYNGQYYGHEVSDEIVYYLKDNGDSVSITYICAKNTHIYMPRTFFRKPVIFDESLNYSWDTGHCYAPRMDVWPPIQEGEHANKVVFVPRALAFTFEKVIERRFKEVFCWFETEHEVGFIDGPISVISYEDCQ